MRKFLPFLLLMLKMKSPRDALRSVALPLALFLGAVLAPLVLMPSRAQDSTTTARRIRETSALLTVGSISDGQFLKRVGSTVVGAAAPSATPAGSSGDIQTNSAGAFGSLTPGTGINTFLGTPSSTNLRSALTDESGTGAATATSVNGSTFPATAAALSGVVHVATSGANSGTGETDLSSYTLPAGALSADGKCLRATVFVAFAANGNAKSVRFYFGSTSIMLPNGSTASGGTVYHVWTICRTGASSQILFGRAAAASSNTGNESQNTDQFQTPAENTANAITVKVTGQSNTASNDVLLKGFVIEILN